jgi:hypothetical protein
MNTGRSQPEVELLWLDDMFTGRVQAAKFDTFCFTICVSITPDLTGTGSTSGTWCRAPNGFLYRKENRLVPARRGTFEIVCLCWAERAELQANAELVTQTKLNESTVSFLIEECPKLTHC